MEAPVENPRGIFALPNELLLSIFNLLPTKALLPLTPTCRQFHALVLRLTHSRLAIAAGLDGHTLYLECHHPSLHLTAPGFFCVSLSTDGLQEILCGDLHTKTDCVGQVKKLGSLYSRFRPQRHDPSSKAVYRHPAGDIPGSRTHSSSQSVPTLTPWSESDPVIETVTVDAHDLFSQLSTNAYLAKRHMWKNVLLTYQDVSEGTIRVWRDWLSKQCQTRTWTDQDTVPVVHEGSSKGKAPADSVIGTSDPTKDPMVLWVNTRDESLGIKFKVKERKARRAAPILFSSDVELAVSYVVEFEEVVVRTMHLLLKLEEVLQQQLNTSGKAIVFGSYSKS